MEDDFPFDSSEAIRAMLNDELSRLVVMVFIHLNFAGHKMGANAIHEAIVNKVPLPISDIQVAASVANYQASLPAKVSA